MALSYSFRKIKQLEEFYPGNWASIRGRIISLFCDVAYTRAYMTVSDDSGMILIKVQNAASQTVFVGAIVSIRGETALYEGKTCLKATDVSKMQPVEDGYSQLAELPVPKEGDLADSEGKRWTKPTSWKTGKFSGLNSVTLKEESRLTWVGVGLAVFLIAFLTPIIVAVPMVLAGIMLIFAGLIAKETVVTQYEALKLQGAHLHSRD